MKINLKQKTLQLHNPTTFDPKIDHSSELFMDFVVKPFICRAVIFLD